MFGLRLGAMPRRFVHVRQRAFVGLFGLLACHKSAEPPATQSPAAPTVPTKPSVTASGTSKVTWTLAHGEVMPVAAPAPIPVKVRAHGTWQGQEIVRLEVQADAVPESLRWASHVQWRVLPSATAGTDPNASAFALRDEAAGTWQIWLRHRPPVGGTLPTLRLEGPASLREPGWRGALQVDAAPRPKSDPKIGEQWLLALSTFLGDSQMAARRDPFAAFAHQRLLARTAKGRNARINRAGGNDSGLAQELSFLMETTTGVLALQETLQTNRALLLEGRKDRATLPVASLAPPRLVEHPFAAMRQALPANPVAERLAALVPAEFYYLRFDTMATLVRTLDEIERWGRPLAAVVEGQHESRDLSTRYETQLGLTRGPLAKTFGDQAVHAVAMIGSDPYLREGSDVTVLFAVKQRPLFEAGLTAAIAPHVVRHGPLTTTVQPYGQAKLEVRRSSDQAVQQVRVTLGDVEVVSNSVTAVQRIVDAAGDGTRSLAQSPDFQYMMAREQGASAQVLGFVSDRFVAAVIGPRQKILQARRQVALAELSTPGYAALLYGWVYGRPPQSQQELIASRLLAADEVTHQGDRQAITWQPGSSAQSSWGTVATLRPLIDAAPVDKVTPAEAQAYARFVENYDRAFSAYIDPILLRANFTPTPQGSQLAIDFRMLPVVEGEKYREVQEMVGTVKLAAQAVDHAGRLIVGIGENAALREEVRRVGASISHQERISLDWLGAWAMIGGIDHAIWAELAQRHIDELEPPVLLTDAQRQAKGDQSDFADLGRMPLYAAIAVKQMAGATLTLAALRKLAHDVAPGMVTWQAHRSLGSAKVVRVGVALGQGNRDELALYYTLHGDALIVALQEAALERALADQASPRWPKAVAVEPAMHGQAPQLVFDLQGERNGGFWSVAYWMFTEHLRERTAAQVLAMNAALRGSTLASLTSAQVDDFFVRYFGSVPRPPEGGAYGWQEFAVVDPQRGTAVQPRWPALPVAHSPLDQLFGALHSVRTELSFDDEGKIGSGPPLRSLHARVVLGLRSPLPSSSP